MVVPVKKIFALLFSMFVILGIVTLTSISVSAAFSQTGTVTGTMQDTSSPSNGEIKWVFEYDKSTGMASLTITGNGYMPNDTEDSWHKVQNEVQCYINKLVIGDGVKSIMEGAFAQEKYLTSVKLPSSIESIGENAFSYTSLTEINIPAKVDYLSGKMFYGSRISKFTVSSNNQYYKAYNGDIYTKSMKTLVVSAPGKYLENSSYQMQIPSSVYKIDPYAFYMSPIKSIVIPSNVKEIRQMAFAGSSIADIRIHSGLRKIYDSVFLSCDKLTSIVLPHTVDYLGYYSIGYTYKLNMEDVEYVLDMHGINHGFLTPSNCQIYLAQAGYTIEQFMVCVPNDTTVIYAPTGSLGESYAYNNNLKYSIREADYTRVNTVKIVEGGIAVKWSASTNATGYKIFRKNSKAEWVLIGTVNSGKTTTYIDKKPKNNAYNEYTVKAFNKSGVAVYEDTGVSCFFIKQPRINELEKTSKGVKVVWEKVSGAENYYVYRKMPGKTDWVKYKTFSSKTTGFTDTNVKLNEKYAYTVSAKKGSVISSRSSKGTEITIVSPPKLTVANATTGVVLKWTFSPKADSFKIFRKTSSTEWKLISTVKGDVRKFVDKNVSGGTKYFYKLAVVSGGRVIIRTETNPYVLCIKAPMKITLTNNSAGVLIKWSKCAGAKGYYVYKKTSSGWSKVATISGANVVSYVDKNVKSGSTYTYMIKAFNGNYVSAYDYDGVKISFLKAPKVSSVKSTKTGMQVKYSACSGAQGYYIYRKTSNTSWKKIATVKGASTQVYYDKTTKKGTSYAYTVRAYKNSFQSTYYSTTKLVKDTH